jgi:hypothetical protein
VPVIQINERSRFIGFRDPGLDLIAGHAGLYVAREPDDASMLASTTAVLTPLGQVERTWRGRVMATYALEKLTGWTPDLSPPPDSPFYKWRQLAEGETRRLESVSTELESDSSHVLLTEHDLIRKPVSTFRDHALTLVAVVGR